MATTPSFEEAQRAGATSQRIDTAQGDTRLPITEPSPTAAYLAALLDLNISVAGELEAAERNLTEQVRVLQETAATQFPNALAGQFSAAGMMGDAAAVVQTNAYIDTLQKVYAVANQGYSLALWQYLIQVHQVRQRALETIAAAYTRLLQQIQGLESHQRSSKRATGRLDHRIADGDFVSYLVRDPSNPPSSIMLFGFPGMSTDENCARFYVDPMMSAYVDIPDEKILGVADLPRSQSPLGGCYVWVEKDPELVATIQNSLNTAISAGQDLWNRPAAAGGFPTTPPGQFPNLMAAEPPGQTAAEPPGQTTDASDDEDVPLPPGWPMTAS